MFYFNKKNIFKKTRQPAPGAPITAISAAQLAQEAPRCKVEVCQAQGPIVSAQGLVLRVGFQGQNG
jgi:hypothetical protein